MVNPAVERDNRIVDAIHQDIDQADPVAEADRQIGIRIRIDVDTSLK